MLSIDEAIVSLRKSASKSLDYEWQREQYQLAEWLEELKELRNMTSGHLYAEAFNMGYLKAEKEARNKAIDDFKSRLEERILAGKMIDEKFAYIDNCDIDEIAEQLKAGDNNGT